MSQYRLAIILREKNSTDVTGTLVYGDIIPDNWGRIMNVVTPEHDQIPIGDNDQDRIDGLIENSISNEKPENQNIPNLSDDRDMYDPSIVIIKKGGERYIQPDIKLLIDTLKMYDNDLEPTVMHTTYDGVQRIHGQIMTDELVYFRIPEEPYGSTEKRYLTLEEKVLKLVNTVLDYEVNLTNHLLKIVNQFWACGCDPKIMNWHKINLEQINKDDTFIRFFGRLATLMYDADNSMELIEMLTKDVGDAFYRKRISIPQAQGLDNYVNVRVVSDFDFPRVRGVIIGFDGTGVNVARFDCTKSGLPLYVTVDIFSNIAVNNSCIIAPANSDYTFTLDSRFQYMLITDIPKCNVEVLADTRFEDERKSIPYSNIYMGDFVQTNTKTLLHNTLDSEAVTHELSIAGDKISEYLESYITSMYTKHYIPHKIDGVNNNEYMKVYATIKNIVKTQPVNIRIVDRFTGSELKNETMTYEMWSLQADGYKFLYPKIRQHGIDYNVFISFLMSDGTKVPNTRVYEVRATIGRTQLPKVVMNSFRTNRRMIKLTRPDGTMYPFNTLFDIKINNGDSVRTLLKEGKYYVTQEDINRGHIEVLVSEELVGEVEFKVTAKEPNTFDSPTEIKIIDMDSVLPIEDFEITRFDNEYSDDNFINTANWNQLYTQTKTNNETATLFKSVHDVPIIIAPNWNLHIDTGAPTVVIEITDGVNTWTRNIVQTIKDIKTRRVRNHYIELFNRDIDSNSYKWYKYAYRNNFDNTCVEWYKERHGSNIIPNIPGKNYIIKVTTKDFDGTTMKEVTKQIASAQIATPTEHTALVNDFKDNLLRLNTDEELYDGIKKVFTSTHNLSGVNNIFMYLPDGEDPVADLKIYKMSFDVNGNVVFDTDTNYSGVIPENGDVFELYPFEVLTEIIMTQEYQIATFKGAQTNALPIKFNKSRSKPKLPTLTKLKVTPIIDDVINFLPDEAVEIETGLAFVRRGDYSIEITIDETITNDKGEETKKSTKKVLSEADIATTDGKLIHKFTQVENTATVKLDIKAVLVQDNGEEFEAKVKELTNTTIIEASKYPFFKDPFIRLHPDDRPATHLSVVTQDGSPFPIGTTIYAKVELENKRGTYDDVILYEDTKILDAEDFAFGSYRVPLTFDTKGVYVITIVSKEDNKLESFKYVTVADCSPVPPPKEFAINVTVGDVELTYIKTNKNGFTNTDDVEIKSNIPRKYRFVKYIVVTEDMDGNIETSELQTVDGLTPTRNTKNIAITTELERLPDVYYNVSISGTYKYDFGNKIKVGTWNRTISVLEDTDVNNSMFTDLPPHYHLKTQIDIKQINEHKTIPVEFELDPIKLVRVFADHKYDMFMFGPNDVHQMGINTVVKDDNYRYVRTMLFFEDDVVDLGSVPFKTPLPVGFTPKKISYKGNVEEFDISDPNALPDATDLSSVIVSAINSLEHAIYPEAIDIIERLKTMDISQALEKNIVDDTKSNCANIFIDIDLFPSKYVMFEVDNPNVIRFRDEDIAKNVIETADTTKKIYLDFEDMNTSEVAAGLPWYSNYDSDNFTVFNGITYSIITGANTRTDATMPSDTTESIFRETFNRYIVNAYDKIYPMLDFDTPILFKTAKNRPNNPITININKDRMNGVNLKFNESFIDNHLDKITKVDSDTIILNSDNMWGTFDSDSNLLEALITTEGTPVGMIDYRGGQYHANMFIPTFESSDDKAIAKDGSIYFGPRGIREQLVLTEVLPDSEAIGNITYSLIFIEKLYETFYFNLVQTDPAYPNDASIIAAGYDATTLSILNGGWTTNPSSNGRVKVENGKNLVMEIPLDVFFNGDENARVQFTDTLFPNIYTTVPDTANIATIFSKRIPGASSSTAVGLEANRINLKEVFDALVRDYITTGNNKLDFTVAIETAPRKRVIFKLVDTGLAPLHGNFAGVALFRKENNTYVPLNDSTAEVFLTFPASDTNYMRDMDIYFGFGTVTDEASYNAYRSVNLSVISGNNAKPNNPAFNTICDSIPVNITHRSVTYTSIYRVKYSHISDILYTDHNTIGEVRVRTTRQETLKIRVYAVDNFRDSKESLTSMTPIPNTLTELVLRDSAPHDFTYLLNAAKNKIAETLRGKVDSEITYNVFTKTSTANSVMIDKVKAAMVDTGTGATFMWYPSLSTTSSFLGNIDIVAKVHYNVFSDLINANPELSSYRNRARFVFSNGCNVSNRFNQNAIDTCKILFYVTRDMIDSTKVNNYVNYNEPIVMDYNTFMADKKSSVTSVSYFDVLYNENTLTFSRVINDGNIIKPATDGTTSLNYSYKQFTFNGQTLDERVTPVNDLNSLMSANLTVNNRDSKDYEKHIIITQAGTLKVKSTDFEAFYYHPVNSEATYSQNSIINILFKYLNNVSRSAGKYDSFSNTVGVYKVNAEMPVYTDYSIPTIPATEVLESNVLDAVERDMFDRYFDVLASFIDNEDFNLMRNSNGNHFGIWDVLFLPEIIPVESGIKIINTDVSYSASTKGSLDDLYMCIDFVGYDMKNRSTDANGYGLGMTKYKAARYMSGQAIPDLSRADYADVVRLLNESSIRSNSTEDFNRFNGNPVYKFKLPTFDNNKASYISLFTPNPGSHTLIDKDGKVVRKFGLTEYILGYNLLLHKLLGGTSFSKYKLTTNYDNCSDHKSLFNVFMSYFRHHPTIAKAVSMARTLNSRDFKYKDGFKQWLSTNGLPSTWDIDVTKADMTYLLSTLNNSHYVTASLFAFAEKVQNEKFMFPWDRTLLGLNFHHYMFAAHKEFNVNNMFDTSTIRIGNDSSIDKTTPYIPHILTSKLEYINLTSGQDVDLFAQLYRKSTVNPFPMDQYVSVYLDKHWFSGKFSELQPNSANKLNFIYASDHYNTHKYVNNIYNIYTIDKDTYKNTQSMVNIRNNIAPSYNYNPTYVDTMVDINKYLEIFSSNEHNPHLAALTRNVASIPSADELGFVKYSGREMYGVDVDKYEEFQLSRFLGWTCAVNDYDSIATMVGKDRARQNAFFIPYKDFSRIYKTSVGGSLEDVTATTARTWMTTKIGDRPHSNIILDFKVEDTYQYVTQGTDQLTTHKYDTDDSDGGSIFKLIYKDSRSATNKWKPTFAGDKSIRTIDSLNSKISSTYTDGTQGDLIRITLKDINDNSAHDSIIAYADELFTTIGEFIKATNPNAYCSATESYQSKLSSTNPVVYWDRNLTGISQATDLMAYYTTRFYFYGNPSITEKCSLINSLLPVMNSTLKLETYCPKTDDYEVKAFGDNNSFRLDGDNSTRVFDSGVVEEAEKLTDLEFLHASFMLLRLRAIVSHESSSEAITLAYTNFEDDLAVYKPKQLVSYQSLPTVVDNTILSNKLTKSARYIKPVIVKLKMFDTFTRPGKNDFAQLWYRCNKSSASATYNNTIDSVVEPYNDPWSHLYLDKDKFYPKRSSRTQIHNVRTYLPGGNFAGLSSVLDVQNGMKPKVYIAITLPKNLNDVDALKDKIKSLPDSNETAILHKMYTSSMYRSDIMVVEEVTGCYNAATIENKFAELLKLLNIQSGQSYLGGIILKLVDDSHDELILKDKWSRRITATYYFDSNEELLPITEVYPVDYGNSSVRLISKGTSTQAYRNHTIAYNKYYEHERSELCPYIISDNPNEAWSTDAKSYNFETFGNGLIYNKSGMLKNNIISSTMNSNNSILDTFSLFNMELYLNTISNMNIKSIAGGTLLYASRIESLFKSNCGFAVLGISRELWDLQTLIFALFEGNKYKYANDVRYIHMGTNSDTTTGNVIIKEDYWKPLTTSTTGRARFRRMAPANNVTFNVPDFVTMISNNVMTDAEFAELNKNKPVITALTADLNLQPNPAPFKPSILTSMRDGTNVYLTILSQSMYKIYSCIDYVAPSNLSIHIPTKEFDTNYIMEIVLEVPNDDSTIIIGSYRDGQDPSRPVIIDKTKFVSKEAYNRVKSGRTIQKSIVEAFYRPGTDSKFPKAREATRSGLFLKVNSVYTKTVGDNIEHIDVETWYPMFRSRNYYGYKGLDINHEGDTYHIRTSGSREIILPNGSFWIPNPNLDFGLSVLDSKSESRITRLF